ncbi:hypothetical protein GCM10011612_17010 [Actinomyces gaoshouyii]|uniref:Uncharacterized protein n=1 Tax=Actinomyces gaoshouyii TaxID=1960083 RepID=A0A8H9HC54_9ACTO|nr:hypothetical protein GCM10011612_17010 [Actinomyces gaoshouyii]
MRFRAPSCGARACWGESGGRPDGSAVGWRRPDAVLDARADVLAATMRSSWGFAPSGTILALDRTLPTGGAGP